MAIDVLRVTEVLKQALLRDLGDEVELIFQYGSLMKGTAHRYSDLDISYVPARESTHHSITVLVDDVMCDLYPIHWSDLERMAEFLNISCTVLLENRIVYQRSDEAGERFRALPARLHALQQPNAQPEMLRKALGIFQDTGYPYYLLRQQATNGHLPSCMQHAQRIRQIVLHCLMVCNQAPIDTRKLPQVLALPMLPAGFAETLERLTFACEPGGLLLACEMLLRTTCDLLLAEQRKVHCRATTFAEVFHAAYPELKGDLQHILLACERQDMFSLSLVSLHHQLMSHMAQAFTGVEYSSFNSMVEYQQDLVALGFPDLWPYVAARDFTGLHSQCKAFDRRLREFLTERGVALNAFDTVEALQEFLAGTEQKSVPA
jgi:hypothetical protein